MAEMITITINGEQIKVPAWSTDSTQQSLIDEINKLNNLSKSQKDAMRKLAEETAKGNNTEKKQNDELIKAINEIKDESKGGAGAFLKDLDIVGSGFKVLGATMAVGLAALSTFVYAVKGLGDDLRDSRGGTSLDLEGGGDMASGAQFRTSMQMLGYTADELNARFQDTSAIVAITGRKSFFELTKEIQNLTGAGGNLGLSLVQIGEALDNDLKLRQQIGILNMLDGNAQAKRSAKLYEMQLKATAILGKSIDEISGSADDTLTTNASVQLLLQSMGEGSQGFVDQINRTASELSASGLTQGVNNAMQNAMLESVAFRTDAGSDLFAALAVLDENAGSDLTERIQQINALSKSDPIAAQKLMSEFGPALVNSAKSLTDEQLAEIRPLIENFGELGTQLYLSIGQLRQSGKAAEDINELAQSAATYDNALQKFNSGINGATTSLFGAFGTPLSQVMNAFTESSRTLDGVAITNKQYMKLTDEQKLQVKGQAGIFETLNEVLEDIMKAFTGLFGKTDQATGKVASFADLIRTKLNPIIKNVGETFANWINDLTAEDVEGFIDGFITTLRIATSVISTLASVIGGILSFIIATETDENGVEQFDLSGTIINAMLIAFTASVVKKALGSLFTVGADKLVSKIPGVGGTGKDLEKTGKSAGKGAKGMLAFGVAAAGVGVALLGISEAMQTFKDMTWGEIAKGVVGITAALIPFGIAIALLGAAGTGPQAIGLWSIAAVLAAIGVAAAGIGVAAGGIAMLVNAFGESAEEKMADRDNMVKNINALKDIPKDQLMGTAQGIDAIADSLERFGDATNDGWFSGPDIDDQYAMLNVFRGFASLDSQNLQAFTSEMGMLIETINDLNAIDTAEIIASAEALKKLNDATSQGFGERLFNTVDMVVDRLLPEETPTVNIDSASPNTSSKAQASASHGGMGGHYDDKVLKALENIETNTKKTKEGVVRLPELITV